MKHEVMWENEPNEDYDIAGCWGYDDCLHSIEVSKIEPGTIASGMWELTFDNEVAMTFFRTQAKIVAELDKWLDRWIYQQRVGRGE